MKRLHRLSALALIFAVAVLFSGCVGICADAQSDFEKIMNTFKTADREKIDEVYNLSEVLGFLEGVNGEDFSDALISTLSKMEYKVNSATKVGTNIVKLNVDITTVDYSEIVNNFIENIIELTQSNDYKAMISSMEEEVYEKQIIGQMVNAINECGDGKVTKTVDVTMTKSGNKWKIGGNSEEFLGALFENISSAVSSFM